MSKALINRVLATDNGASALALRIPVGIIFAASGGYEFALAPFAASMPLLFSGAGRFSVGRRITGAR